VQQNRGTIEVDSQLGKGTCFRIVLPAIEATAVELELLSLRPDQRAQQHAPRGTETVLLVEDDPMLLDLARCALEDAGYQVLACPDPDEALRVFVKVQRDVHLLVTDVVMPRMNGKELAARILAFRPELRVLYMSGYGENIIATRGVIDVGIAFMAKPYRPADLVTKVRAVLDGEPLRGQGDTAQR
jgi:DNA-binding response OmpR family regulator